MKTLVLSSLIFLIALSFTACKSPAKAAIKHETGIGKGPVEKATDTADKKVKDVKSIR